MYRILEGIARGCTAPWTWLRQSSGIMRFGLSLTIVFYLDDQLMTFMFSHRVLVVLDRIMSVSLG